VESEDDAGVDIRANNNTVFGNIISNNGATGIYLMILHAII